MALITIVAGVKIVEDDENPRIYQRYFKCYKCKEWIEEDEVLWVDPVTGRQVLDCCACGSLVWLDPTPCTVSVMCERCASHCAKCGDPLIWTKENASDKHNGRCLCNMCWEYVDEFEM